MLLVKHRIAYSVSVEFVYYVSIVRRYTAFVIISMVNLILIFNHSTAHHVCALVVNEKKILSFRTYF